MITTPTVNVRNVANVHYRAVIYYSQFKGAVTT